MPTMSLRCNPILDLFCINVCCETLGKLSSNGRGMILEILATIARLWLLGTFVKAKSNEPCRIAFNEGKEGVGEGSVFGFRPTSTSLVTVSPDGELVVLT